MYKTKQWPGLKILTSKQMLQKLLIAHAQVKVGNRLLNRNQANCLLFVLIKNKKLKKYTIT